MDIACEEEFTAAQATEVLVQVAAGFKDFIRTGGRNVKRKGCCSKMNVESQCASQCASQSFCARKPRHVVPEIDRERWKLQYIALDQNMQQGGSG